MHKRQNEQNNNNNALEKWSSNSGYQRIAWFFHATHACMYVWLHFSFPFLILFVVVFASLFRSGHFFFVMIFSFSYFINRQSSGSRLQASVYFAKLHKYTHAYKYINIYTYIHMHLCTYIRSHMAAYLLS